MLRKITWVTVPLLAIAMAMTTETTTADAGGFGIQVGNFGYNPYGSRFRGYNHFGYGHVGIPVYRNYYPSHRFNHGGNFHHPRRPHLDWHGPSLVPHGNHFDYIPGHWDLHYGRHHH